MTRAGKAAIGLGALVIVALAARSDSVSAIVDAIGCPFRSQ
jgi:hypothetical protein